MLRSRPSTARKSARSWSSKTPALSRRPDSHIPLMRLKEKVIIVTGSCTGIGKAIAERCVAEGARVLVHGLERELGEAVVRELAADKAALHIEDLTVEGAPERIIQAAVSAFGKLDAVVNNAARVGASN